MRQCCMRQKEGKAMTGWIGKEDVCLAQLCTDIPFDFGSRDYYKHAEQASDVAGFENITE
jgi:hypothetical protein